MKKLVFNVELILNDNMPSKVDVSKEDLEKMITESIREETSKNEITGIFAKLMHFEGITLS